MSKKNTLYSEENNETQNLLEKMNNQSQIEEINTNQNENINKNRISIKNYLKLSFYIYMLANLSFFLFFRLQYTYNVDKINIKYVNEKINQTEALDILVESQKQIIEEKIKSLQKLSSFLMEIYLSNEQNDDKKMNSLQFVNDNTINKNCDIEEIKQDSNNIQQCIDDQNEIQPYGIDQQIYFTCSLYQENKEYIETDVKLKNKSVKQLQNLNFLSDFMLKYLIQYDIVVDLFYQIQFIFYETNLIVQYPTNIQVYKNQLEYEKEWYDKTLELEQKTFTVSFNRTAPYLITMAQPIILNDQTIGVVALQLLSLQLNYVEDKDKVQICDQYKTFIFDQTGFPIDPFQDYASKQYSQIQQIYIDQFQLNQNGQSFIMDLDIPQKVCQFIQGQLSQFSNYKCNKQDTSDYLISLKEINANFVDSNIYFLSYCINNNNIQQDMNNLLEDYKYIYIIILILSILVIVFVLSKDIDNFFRDYISPLKQLNGKLKDINTKIYNCSDPSQIYQKNIVLQDNTQLNIIYSNFNLAYDYLFNSRYIQGEQYKLEDKKVNKFKNKQFCNYIQQIKSICNKIIQQEENNSQIQQS